MNAESLLDPLITIVVYIALTTVAAVALFAAYSFVKALWSLRNIGFRRRVIGM